MMLSCLDEFELVRKTTKYGARGYIPKLSIDLVKIPKALGETWQDLADLPENEPHLSLSTDDLKYLFIKKLQNRGFTSDEQIENVLHNIQLTISLKNYCLMRFTFELEIAKIPDDNHGKTVYNLLDRLCQRYPGDGLFLLDEKGYLIIRNAGKDDFLYRQISAAMKQYASQTIYFGISPGLKDYSVFKDGLKQADDTLNICVFYEKAEPLTFQVSIPAGFPFITSCLARKLYTSLSSGSTEKSYELVSHFLFWLRNGLFFSSLYYSYLEEILNTYVRIAREQNPSTYRM